MTILEAIAFYKDNFSKCWEDEKYKWIAVEHFQDTWDIDAVDFAGMLEESLSLTYTVNLLQGRNYYPYKMAVALARQNPDKMRGLFKLLYDETKPLVERLQPFRSGFDELMVEFREKADDPKKAKNHYQDLRAICVYLSFQFPEKYYLFKSRMYNGFKKLINYQETSQEKDPEIRKYDNFARLCGDVVVAIKADSELLEMQRNKVDSTPSCYDDTEYHLLTQTIIYVNQPDNIVIEPAKAKYTRWLGPIVDALYELGGKAERTPVMEKVFSMCAVSEAEVAEVYGSGTSKIKNEIDRAMLSLYAEGIICGNTRGLWELSELGQRILITDDLAGRIVTKWNKIKLAKEQGDKVPEIDLTPYYTYRDSENDEWLPTLVDYSPGFTKEQWLEVLRLPGIIGPTWTGALAAFYEMGGEATCTQIAERFHMSPSSVSGHCTNLSKRIHWKTNCPLYTENGKTQYWSILFQRKKAESNVLGAFIWKLRSELYEALTEFDIMRYRWEIADGGQSENKDIQYWWLNANPKIWSFSSRKVGESQSYTLYNENGNKRRIFQNFLDANVGDMIIGYESNPVKQVVAIGRVSEKQDGEKLLFEKVEGLTSPIDYATLKGCPELENMEYFQNPQGSLFKLTRDEYEFILDLIREENPASGETSVDVYAKNDFLSEVFMTEKRYDSLEALLRKKKNLILQGAPGVGKTFAARRLAWSMMGEKDDNRIALIQFHQNYSYEDFMMGYKPVGDGFELKHGVFYRFCQKAANQPEKDFFFIIDEINRGNMSKVFGELLMLIEKDYRGTIATMAYNGLPFSVPGNLYIIGMMNTADRSLAMIDYALRRRFSFFEMEPEFDSEGFMAYQQGLHNNRFDALIEKIKVLNRQITQDKSLGKGFCIGHSYFCGCESSEDCTDEWLRSIVNYDIIPTLSEYWFDDSAEVERWSGILQGVFHDQG